MTSRPGLPRRAVFRGETVQNKHRPAQVAKPVWPGSLRLLRFVAALLVGYLALGWAGRAGAEETLRITPYVQADLTAGKLVAVAGCAADLYPPSPEIARIKAERIARNRAEERLRQALLLLVRDHGAKLAALGGPERLAQLDPKKALVEKVDYGAQGSVVLWLALNLREKPSP